MNGTIISHQGQSRYSVTLDPDNPLLTAELAVAQTAVTKAAERVTETRADEAKAQAAYDDALAAARVPLQAYEEERDSRDVGDFIDAEMARCQAVHEAGVTACEDARRVAIEKCNETHGTCLQGCQDQACVDRCNAARDACWAEADATEAACLAAATRALDTCEEQSTLVGQQTYQAFLADCYQRHAPAILAAQQVAMEKRPALREAVFQRYSAEVKQLSANQRLTELQRIATTPAAATVWSAQYTEDLAPGSTVTVAVTPAGSTVITDSELASVDTQPYDARSFPSALLFFNAALAPGVETWLPSWRTGTVTAIGASTLTVEIDGGLMAGTLGTAFSRTPINCTPPQAFFDGAVDETAIVAARQALTAAQEAEADIAEARAECPQRFDLSAYTAPGDMACQSEWAGWLTACLESGTGAAECQETYARGLAACRGEVLQAGYEARDADLAACLAEHPIAAAQANVLAAQAALQTALANLRDPASPLVREIPVEHCSASMYQVGDRVLIDFPVRTATTADPVAVWKSARVIGWAENTRRCSVHVKYSVGSTTGGNCYLTDGVATGQVIEDDVVGGMGPAIFACPPSRFLGWSDADGSNPRVDTGLTENLDVKANFGDEGDGGPLIPPDDEFNIVRSSGCLGPFTSHEISGELYDYGEEAWLAAYQAWESSWVLGDGNGWWDFVGWGVCHYGVEFAFDQDLRIIYGAYPISLVPLFAWVNLGVVSDVSQVKSLAFTQYLDSRYNLQDGKYHLDGSSMGFRYQLSEGGENGYMTVWEALAT